MALQVMNEVVLGGGPTGRLVQSTSRGGKRAKHLWQVGSFGHRAHPPWRVNGRRRRVARTEVTDPAGSTTCSQKSHSCAISQGFWIRELADAKRVSDDCEVFALSLENPAQLLNYYVTRVGAYALAGRLPGIATPRQRVGAIGGDRGVTSSRGELLPRRIDWQIVAVGDPEAKASRHASAKSWDSGDLRRRREAQAGGAPVAP